MSGYGIPAVERRGTGGNTVRLVGKRIGTVDCEAAGAGALIDRSGDQQELASRTAGVHPATRTQAGACEAEIPGTRKSA